MPSSKRVDIRRGVLRFDLQLLCGTPLARLGRRGVT